MDRILTGAVAHRLSRGGKVVASTLFAGMMASAYAQPTVDAGKAPAEPCASVTAKGVTPLTGKEKAQGWQMLWDGQTSAGWRGAKSETFPATGWSMCNGVLSVHGSNGEESRGGGDIITIKRYANFELTADFLLTPGANSGIKVFTQPNLSPIDKLTGKPAAQGSAIGIEFQVLDDQRHPDAKLGHDGNRTIGSMYDLIAAPKDKLVMPVGEWNRARIRAQGHRLTFWLNGKKTIDVERGSPAFRAAVAASKFRDIPGFGEWADGHILLQDHGDSVSYRNIKIRELSAN